MKFSVTRTNEPLPTEQEMQVVRKFLTECIRGANDQFDKVWNRFLGRLKRLEPGEVVNFETIVPRSGPFHRRHMAIEQAVFNAQEKFEDFEQFRYWLKVGAAWVTWAAGPKGGVVPIPRSISYASADEDEFRQYHEQVIAFLRGPHAAPYLWKHLPADQAHEMMDSILEEFDE